MRTTYPARRILLNMITLIFVEMSSLRSLLQPPATSSLTLFSDTLSMYVLPFVLQSPQFIQLIWH